MALGGQASAPQRLSHTGVLQSHGLGCRWDLPPSPGFQGRGTTPLASTDPAHQTPQSQDASRGGEHWAASLCFSTRRLGFYSCCCCFLFNIYFREKEGETQRNTGAARTGEGQRERETQNPPDAGLKPMNCEIVVTWAEVGRPTD